MQNWPGGDRSRHRVRRHSHRADGLGVLRLPGCPGRPPRRSPFLRHHSHGPRVRTAIAEDTWTPIRYPRAIWDDQLGRWISDAQVAEAEYTTFAGKKGQAVAARTARHGRGYLTMHLPEGWHREHDWMNLFEAACRPPPAAAA
jgi:hypothetical protein